MKKQSMANIVLKNFLKTIGIILLFVAVGVLSYYLTMLFYNQTTRTERSTKYTHVISVNAGNESSNLIYSYNKDTKKIEAMVLELFDETTKNLDYVTIPVNTQITISANTYSELMKVSQSVPQLATMSNINTYFSGDVAYEYGIMILQEELKIDIGYFTAMTSDEFAKYFEKKSKSAPVYQPKKEVLDAVAQGDIGDYMETAWDKLISDITLSQKQHYAESLAGVKREYIHLHSVYGSKSGDVFVLNKRKSKKMINDIWETGAYSSAQTAIDGSLSKVSAKTVSSVGRSIQITNGSKIDGLAAAYQEKMKTDGLNVLGVGDYKGEIQTKTKILVKKKKWGRDLLKYFKNATVEKADNLTNGADIEIILGTEDDLS